MAEAKRKSRRRERKSVPRGRAYVNSSFNNTLVTLTDTNGNVISSSSSGASGFKGSRKKHAVRGPAGRRGRCPQGDGPRHANHRGLRERRRERP